MKPINLLVLVNLQDVNTIRYNNCTTIRYNNMQMRQWLRCCYTNRKVAVSFSAGVSGFFIDVKSLRSHYGPGIDSASNRNEYQEHFLGAKAAVA